MSSKALEQVYKQLKNDWLLTEDGETIHSPTSLLAPVLYQGQQAMLKVFSVKSDEHYSAKALEHFGESAAVKILLKNEQAILLERCQPGHSLKQLSLTQREQECIDIFCQITNELHQRPCPKNYFPDIEELWGDRLKHFTPSQQIPIELLKPAQQLFKTLAHSQKNKVLLHGDLHHDNILFDAQRGWLAIDPKGIIGEREIEACAFLKNPINHPEIFNDRPLLLNRINSISNTLQLDKQRVIQWGYTLTTLSCIWLCDINEDPSDWLKLLQILKELL